MKIITILLTTFFYAISTFSAPVSENIAKQIAENFFTSKEQFMSNENIYLAFKCKSEAINPSFNIVQSNINYYYVYNLGTTGFIIISADDNTYPVLAYSDETSFNIDDLPQNVAKWLEGYKQQIRYIIENNIQSTDEIKNEWNEWLSGKDFSAKLLASVSPLIQTKWNQSPYYNALCPYDYTYQDKTVTGCTATAMAQIMKFWNYPEKGNGFYSYNHSTYGTLSSNFGSTNYDWSSMPNNVSSSNIAVATLMYHCGVSVDMDYGVAATGGSGAYVISIGSPNPEKCVEFALKTYFGYSSTLKGLKRNDYSDFDWKNLIKKELNEGRPIQYAGFGQGGHTFVCDGYDNNDFFHMNWGWGGMHDGYFNLNALNPGTGGAGSGAGSFNSDQQALIGIQPPTGAITYNLEIYEDVETNKSSIGYGNGFVITTDIVNRGTNTFVGDYCAAVFDNDNVFVDYVEIKTGNSLPPNYHYTDGLTFTTDGIFSMLPGIYKVYIFYRPTDGNWIGLRADSWNNYSDIYTEIKVVNANDIKLNSSMRVIPENNLTQGQSASVNLNILNDGETTFIGQYSINLYNLDGSGVQNINTIDESNGLPSGYTYKQPYLTFSTNSIIAEPGTYLMAVVHKTSNSSNWELTGSTNEFTNPIKVIVQAAPYSADIYESNNDIASAFNLLTNYSNNNAKIKSTGSNFHIGNDIDFYKINLESGFSYSIGPRLQDAFSNNDGNNYTVDALFTYSTDGINWSDAYDDVLPKNIELNGQQTVYFVVSPFFLGQTGTYLLDMNISRSPIGSVDEILISELIDVYPNPASEFILVDFSKYNKPISEIKLQNIFGDILYIQRQPLNSIAKIPTKYLSNGAYFLVLTDNAGNILTKNISVIK